MTVIQKTKKLLDRFNNSISLLNILGMSNSKIKKYDTAINYYQKALKVDPNHPLTLFHLGVVFQDIFDFDSSIRYYKRAIHSNSNYIDPLLYTCVNSEY